MSYGSQAYGAFPFGSSLVAATYTITFAVDSALQKSISKTFTLSSVLLKTQSITLSLSARTIHTDYLPITIDAILVLRTETTITVDSTTSYKEQMYQIQNDLTTLFDSIGSETDTGLTGRVYRRSGFKNW